MSGQLTRIFSDIHYGDRASQVRRLSQLRPLLLDTDAVILNGDTVDTRTGPDPRHTARVRTEVLALARSSEPPLTLLTGNHDPDLSDRHFELLAGGEVFVTHGDVLFEDIVPWGRDAGTIRRQLQAAVAALAMPAGSELPFADRIRIWRMVAASIPQRHQSEQNPLRYAAQFILDTAWPPTRFVRIFRAWAQEPALASRHIGRQFPRARFIILGHTHRPAIRRLPNGPIVINTGSFTAPFGGYAIEVGGRALRVFRITSAHGEFRRGALVTEFPLATP